MASITWLTNRVQVIGTIWMPNTTCAMDYTLSDNDVESLRDENGIIERSAIAEWLDTHAGDFQSVIDFQADFGDDFVSAWENEENEMIYNDCMYGMERITDMTIEPEVTFNMNLVNGRLPIRFCYEAASILSDVLHRTIRVAAPDQVILNAYEMGDYENGECAYEVIQHWTERLDNAGYYVWWNAGDVVVYDLRPLSNDDCEQFYSEMENA
jgi:hypothetical protein